MTSSVTEGQTETQSRKENCSRSYSKLEQDRNNPIEVAKLEMGKKPYPPRGSQVLWHLELITFEVLFKEKEYKITDIKLLAH